MQTASWQSDYQDSLKSIQEINNYFDLKLENIPYPSFIPLNIAKKIKEKGKGSPLWNQFIPDQIESSPLGHIDPIGDSNFNT